MYRKFLGKSKRIVAIALAGAMIFGSMTVYAEDEKQTSPVVETQQQDAEEEKQTVPTAEDEKQSVLAEEEKQTTQVAEEQKGESVPVAAKSIKASEKEKPQFTDYVYDGESLIGDKDLNLEAAMIQFGNAGTEAINLSDYEYRVRGIENCENVDLKVAYKSWESIEPGEEAEYSSISMNVEGVFPENYTQNFAKFVVDVYAKDDPETVVYTTKEAKIYPYKIVATDEGRVMKYNDPSHYSKYEVKVETDEHSKFAGLVYGGSGDSTEIFEFGSDGKPVRTGIFVHTGYPSSFMMSYEEGYVSGSAKLEPSDAGTVRMGEGSGCIYLVDVHKPATLKVTSSTEAVLEGEYGLKFVTDGTAENSGTLSGMEMLVKTYEDDFDWLKQHYGANGEILAYETTVKLLDGILANNPDLKMSIEGDAPRIYIPIPDGWDKEKIGVFYDYDTYSNAKTAEVTEDGKYVIAYPEGFEKEFSKVTTKVGIFEKLDPTVAKDWEIVAYNYIFTMRSVNWMDPENKTFDQRFFEETAKANDVAFMTQYMEKDKYVDNYRVGESYSLEIPYDVLVKDAAKYYKNVPDLKQTNMEGFFYYDAEKDAFISPEGGIGDVSPSVKVIKVDELGNKTYAIRFEFLVYMDDPTSDYEATLVVEDNGQGNWRYLSFLKGYPEIAPIEPEEPEPTKKKSATLISGTWTGKDDIVIEVEGQGNSSKVFELYYHKNEMSLGGVKIKSLVDVDKNGNGTITFKNEDIKKATTFDGEKYVPFDWKKADTLEVVIGFSDNTSKYVFVPIDYKEETENPENPVGPKPEKPIENPNKGQELSDEVVGQVVEAVENAKKDSKVVIKMNGATVVPKETLEALKGKNVNLVLDMGTYSWTINGKDVTAATLKDINLKVTVGSNAIPQKLVDKVANGNEAIQISLAHDGAFGFKADLKLSVGAENKGKTAKLYYYNEDGKLELVQSATVASDGTVVFTFEHASDYVVVLEENDGTEGRTPKTGDTSAIALYVIMMILAGGFVVFAGRRRCCK